MKCNQMHPGKILGVFECKEFEMANSQLKMNFQFDSGPSSVTFYDENQILYSRIKSANDESLGIYAFTSNPFIHRNENQMGLKISTGNR